MFKRTSDLHERLPAFNDLLEVIRCDEMLGAFQNVDPKVVELIRHATPVGLDDYRNVKAPESYDYTEGPLILLRNAKEKKEIRANQLRKHVVEKAAVLMDRSVEADTRFRRTIYHEHTEQPMVVGQPITYTDDDGIKNKKRLPLIMLLPAFPGNSHADTISVAHESTHWGDLLDDPFSDSHHHVLAMYNRAVSEVNATSSGYEVIDALDIEVPGMDLSELVEEISDLSPKKSGQRIIRKMRTVIKGDAGNFVHAATIGGKALSIVFNTDSEVCTSDVLTSYIHAGLL